MTARPVRLLLDEHVWEGLAEALIQRGYDVVHLNQTEQRGLDDAPLLEYATMVDRVILTFNVRHFMPLARVWFQSGKEHPGIVLSSQLGRSELMRQTAQALRVQTQGGLHNTVRWLQEFRNVEPLP